MTVSAKSPTLGIAGRENATTSAFVMARDERVRPQREDVGASNEVGRT